MSGTAHEARDAAVHALLRGALEDPETGWTFGSFGALAQFRRDPGEAGMPVPDGRFGRVTRRGAIILTPCPELRPLAYETAFASGWSHAIALCLPEQACAMAGRRVVTELGPDREAARAEDRQAILFDLGLGLRAVDACLRVSDPALLALLRARDEPTLAQAIADQPVVFLTRIGRIEVYPQPEDTPRDKRVFIEKPVLRAGRTHPATAPIPVGYVPCGALHPPHPCKDAHGRTIPFEQTRHDAFQTLLNSWGDPALVAAKRAAEAGTAPPPGPGLRNRYLRAALRAARVQAPYLRGDASLRSDG
ncbi:DUF6925 family protein [Methylobacterium komagatae]